MSINTDYRVQDGINVDKNLEKNEKAHKIKEIGLSYLKGLGAIGLTCVGLGCLGISVVFVPLAIGMTLQTPLWPVALLLAAAGAAAIVLSIFIITTAMDMYDSAKESVKNASKSEQAVDTRKEEINKL
jgi:hypothetical protein